MTVLITLTLAGADSGPFDLYSNLTAFTIPFETNVNKLALQAGYSSALVPDYTSVIRVKSEGDCTNYVDIVLQNITTTTTTTAGTTTTTTTSVPTTTTTTTDPYSFTFMLSAAYSTSTDACNLGIPNVYSVKSNCSPAAMSVGCKIKTLLGFDFAGGGNFYLMNLSPKAIQIDGSGNVLAVVSC